MKNLETYILDYIKPYVYNLIDERIKERIGDARPAVDFTVNDELPLSMKELSRRIGLSKSFLYQQVSQNKIPYHKRCGRLYFIPSEIREWILGPGRKLA